MANQLVRATLPSLKASSPSTKREVTSSNYQTIYLIAGITALLLLLALISICCYLCYRYHKRNKKRPRESYYLVTDKNPDITIQPYDFVLPSSVARSFSSTDDLNTDTVFTDDQESVFCGSNGSLTSSTTARGRSRTPPAFHGHKFSQRKFSEPLDQDGQGIKTSMGFLRPELYQVIPDDNEETDFPLGHIGRLWFRLEYNIDKEQLIVTLHRIKNLPARQQRGSLSMSGSSSCDPFVRIYLLPDEKRYLQSKMKRKTVCPTFDETFIFVMSYGILCHRTLRFSVFDVDRFMRQTIVGHLHFPLENLDITRATEEWGDLVKSSQVPSDSIGEVFVATTYFPQQSRVGVTIVEARNLQHIDYPLLDPYVKVSLSVLTKVIKTKRTSVQQATNNPTFNHSFEFKVNSEQLHLACINVEVMHSIAATLKNDKSVGKAVLGGAMCAKGKELEHWNEMMNSPCLPVKNWFTLKSDK